MAYEKLFGLHETENEAFLSPYFWGGVRFGGWVG